MIQIELDKKELDFIKERHFLFFLERIDEFQRFNNYTRHSKILEVNELGKFINKNIFKVLTGSMAELKEMVEYKTVQSDLIKNYDNLNFSEQIKFNLEFNKIISYSFFSNRKSKKSTFLQDRLKFMNNKKEFKKIIGVSKNIPNNSLLTTEEINRIDKRIEKEIRYIKNLKKRFSINITTLRIEEKLKTVKSKLYTISNELISIYDDLNDSYVDIQSEIAWNPYIYIKGLNIKVCPYCNVGYLTVIDNKQERKKPDLDHFLSKNNFVFFEMSIFNLIPSCKVCNQSFKGGMKLVKTSLNEEKFIKEPIFRDRPELRVMDNKVHLIYDCLSPFDGGANENMSVFKMDKLSKEPFNSIDDFQLTVNRREILNKESKLLHNIDIFRIEEVYQMHKDCAFEIVEKIEANGHSYITGTVQLLKDILGVDYTMGRAYKDIFGNNYDYDSFSHRALSKLHNDISKQFNIDKYLR